MVGSNGQNRLSGSDKRRLRTGSGVIGVGFGDGENDDIDEREDVEGVSGIGSPTMTGGGGGGDGPGSKTGESGFGLLDAFPDVKPAPIIGPSVVFAGKTARWTGKTFTSEKAFVAVIVVVVQ